MPESNMRDFRDENFQGGCVTCGEDSKRMLALSEVTPDGQLRLLAHVCLCEDCAKEVETSFDPKIFILAGKVK